MICQPGDWVTFYQNGRIVLAVVRYRRKNPDYPYSDYVVDTDLGQEKEEHILECRREAVGPASAAPEE